MNEKREDRRVHRTRRLLREALTALILERGYDAVTVEEIAQRADVGRTTFYLHYRDKEDLLLESIDATINDLITQIAGLPLETWQATAAPQYVAPQPVAPQPVAPQQTAAASPLKSPILLVFEHAVKNYDLYRVMLRGEGVSRAQSRIRQTIAQAAKAFFLDQRANQGLHLKPGITLDFFANYFASSLMGVLTWWLEDGMPYPPEAMAEMFQRMFIPGAQAVIELGPGS